MLLPQTYTALAELPADTRFASGGHVAYNPQENVYGLEIGEVAFDPSVHSASDIMPFSPTEELTGQQQVEMVLPYKPLTLNIVADYVEKSNDHPNIRKIKALAVQKLLEAIEESMPSIMDRVYSYSLGESIQKEQYLTQKIPDAELPVMADKVADISNSGLSIMISDFRRLPVAETGKQLPETIAIKVNHPAELSLPKNCGVIALGGALEVNTNNSKSLDNFNAILNSRHQAIVDKLKASGMSVITAVTNHKMVHGLDIAQIDQDLAQAIRNKTLE